MDLKQLKIRSRLRNKFQNFEKKLPLEKFIPSAFLLFLLCLIILTVIIFRNIIEYKHDLEMVNHTNEVIKSVESIHNQIIELPSKRRGFLMSGDKEFLKSFDDLKDKLKTNIKSLFILITDDPGQKILVSEIDSLSDENIKLMSSSMLIPLKNETREFQINLTNKIQSNLDTIKNLTNRVVENETALLTNTRAKAETMNNFIQIIIISTSLFSFIVIVLSLIISNKLIKNKNRAEKLLTESYENLEDIVEEQTRELKQTNERLEEEIVVRKKIEETLRESELNFRAMAESEIKKAEELISKRNSLLNVLNDIIKFTNRSFDLEESIKYSIDKVCQYTKWDIGHCFLKKSDNLITTKIWNENLSENYLPFKDFTENIKFEKGEGTPGKTYETGKAYWIKMKDMTETEFFKRAEITKQCGLKTGIWVPIMKQNEPLGVIEFFKDDEDDLDTEVLECIVNIGIELGSVFEKLETIDKIKHSEKLLNEAQHIAKLGSWEWDVMKNIVNWSDEMYAVYELTQQNFKPTFEGFLERVHPDDRENVKGIIYEAFNRKKSYSFYHRIITPSGKIKILKAQGETYLDENGNVTRMFGTGHDITDIRDAEENLRISEKKLREAQKIAKLGNWEWDIKNNKVILSDEACFIYEIAAENGEFRESEIDELVFEEDKSLIQELRQKIYKGLRNPSVVYRIKTKSGKIKYVKTVGEIYYNEKNEPNRATGIIIDITDIKVVEDELKKTNEKLLETQKELIHNEKLAALGRFSSGIAHEIRNPLANISSLAQMVVNADVDEKNKKRLQHILTNSEIANKIIKSLLNFASPEDLIFKQENLDRILHNVVESIEARCSEKNIKIVKEISPDTVMLKLDKLKLENAFMNFVSNSIDAMETGGTLTIRKLENNISNEVIIDIIDTGVGIPKENMDKILEPFYTTKNDGVGLGLGLSYQTIKSHGGVFIIKSEEGKGTHIKLKFPIQNNGIN